MTDPQTAPVPQTPDPLADAVRSYLSRPRVDPARAALVGAAAQNPDQAAKTQRDAQVLGIPPAAAQGAPGDADLQARMKEMGLDRLSLDHPRTAAFLSDPQNAAVAHDDLPALKAMEITLSDGSKQLIDVGSVGMDRRSMFQQFLDSPFMRNVLGLPLTQAATQAAQGLYYGGKSSFKTVAGGYLEAVAAVQRAQGNLLRSGMVPSFFGDPTEYQVAANASQLGAEQLGGEGRAASAQVPTTLPGKVFGAAGGIVPHLTPIAPLTMGLQGFGQGVEGARESGGETDTQMTSGLAQGGINAVVGLAGPLGKGGSELLQGARFFGHPTGALLTKELAGESASIFNQLVTGSLKTSAEFTAMGSANRAIEAAATDKNPGGAAVSGLPSDFLQGALFHLGNLAIQTAASGKQLRDMTAIADQSKLRERMPERFADAVNGMAEGTGAENIRVPAPEFDRVMAQKGLDPEEQAGLLNAKNYAEAKLSGSDLLIPVGDYFAHLAPTEAGKELAQHARLTPDALSDAELRSFQQGAAPDELTAQGKGLIAPDERASKIQAIQEDIQRQLEGAGFTPSVSGTNAKFYANAIANLAERGGVDPLDLQRQIALTVSREGLPEGDVPRGTPSEVQVQPVERRAGGDRADQIRELIGKRKAGTMTPEEGDLLHDLNERDRIQAKVAGKDIPGALNTTAYSDEYAAGRLKAVQVFSDLDDFKRVNDTFGHPAGDQAIKAFGTSLVKHFGEGNVFHRGGDEFVAQHDDPTQARALMEQVREDMARFQVKGGVEKGERRQQTGVGLSYGVGPVSEHVNEATGAHDPSHEAELAQYADKAARKAAGLRVGVREDVPKGAEPTELAQGPDRGTIRFGDGKPFKITLLDGADLSTFLHETGHLYTEVIGKLAQGEKASDQLKADYQTLRKHAGAAEGFEPLTTEQHETLARSLEAYFREGKAPSEGLRAVFERVKNWLKLIYRSALDLRVNLSDDVRQVFDRVYASDAEIEAAKARTGDQTNLFRSAAEMGVSQKEFEDYIGRTEARDRTAKDALRRVLVGDYERELTKAAKVEKEGIRAEVQQELDADPRYEAWEALKTGKTKDGLPVSLSREALVERYGEEAVKALPLRLKRLFSATGGLDADGAADLLGFRSGDALLANLKDLPPQKDAVAAEVDRRYKLQNPDALTDGTLPSKAVEELHNRSREEVLATELRALRRLQGARASDLEAKRGSTKPLSPSAQATQASRAVPPAKAFRAAAAAIISDTQVRDLDPRGYLAAGRRAATEADTAFAAHDFAKAADAKQRELLSHHLYLEAVKAKSEVEKIAKRALGLQKPDAQARLAKAGGTYREQVNALLGRYEMTRVPLETLAKREGLAEWAQNQRNEGYEPDLDPQVLDEARRINYRQATVGELRAVGDALKTITHVARQQLEMVVNGKKIEFEATKDALKAAAKAAGSGHGEPLSGTDKTVFQRIGSGLVAGDAVMRKIERVFRMLDGDKIGPWTESFFKPIADAQGHYYELNRLVTKPLREAMQGLPKNIRRGLSDTFEVDGFDQPINRRQLLTMALNQGNEGNQRVLREGYGLTQEQVDAAFKNLSGDEARFVQKVWGIMELLREPAAEQQKRFVGKEPDWVESKPYTFQTKDGEVHTEGGYIPLAPDRDLAAVGPKVSADALLQPGYVRATTSQGYLKDRTGATYPLLLDFQRILSQHVVGVTKDIAFREAAVAINKLMSDQSVRLAIDDSLGRAYRKQIEPWLRNILNDSNDTAAKGLRDVSTVMNGIRRNVSAGTIGFKLTSMLSIPTDLFRAWEPFRPGDSTSTRVSTKHLALAYKDFISNPLEMTKLVRQLSPEMRDRPHAIDRDIRSLFEHELVRPALSGNPLDAVSAFKNHAAMFAYEGFAVVDAMVSVPTWLGAYRQAMEQGLPEARARFQADATVRLSLESGQPKDLVALQRNNDFTRLLTMFNGWGFSAYDLMRSLGREAKTPAGVAKTAFYGLLGISASNMMASLLTGHGPQKNENWGEWAARVGLLAPFEVVPVVRDLADSTVGRLTGQGGDMRISPVLTAFEKVGNAAVAQGKFAMGDMEVGDYLTVTGEALGLMTGTPGTEQAVATSKYLRRVANGEEVPDNGADLAYRAAVGKPKGK